MAVKLSALRTGCSLLCRNIIFLLLVLISVSEPQGLVRPEGLGKLMGSGDRLCGLVVRVLGYRSGGPGSIPGTTKKKSSGSGTGSTQPREYN
jgi:hypothetical protein